MTAYLLDTNAASDAIKGNPARVRERLVALPVRDVAISAVTQGELIYGLEKCGNPEALRRLIHEFLIRVEVLPWTADIANVYGSLRAACSQRAVNLGALDMMIAAQAVVANTVLVTRDKAFGRIEQGLQLEDWTK